MITIKNKIFFEKKLGKVKHDHSQNDIIVINIDTVINHLGLSKYKEPNIKANNTNAVEIL